MKRDPLDDYRSIGGIVLNVSIPLCENHKHLKPCGFPCADDVLKPLQPEDRRPCAFRTILDGTSEFFARNAKTAVCSEPALYEKSRVAVAVEATKRRHLKVVR